MSNLRQAIWVETLKARRSWMPLLTALAFALMPVVGGFFMVVLRDPDLARRVGLISAKAQITVGTADWPAYIGFLAMSMATGGVIVFGFIGSWVFGREFADRTVKDLLALPTSRAAIVWAKVVVIEVWCALLSAVLYLFGLGTGLVIGLPPALPGIFWQGTVILAITASLTAALVTPIAFFASAGHGYLPPIGFTVLVIALAQILGLAGWGEYFPWAIPGLVAQGGDLAATSVLIVALTSAAGMAGTLLWWQLADQAR